MKRKRKNSNSFICNKAKKIKLTDYKQQQFQLRELIHMHINSNELEKSRFNIYRNTMINHRILGNTFFGDVSLSKKTKKVLSKTIKEYIGFLVSETFNKYSNVNIDNIKSIVDDRVLNGDFLLYCKNRNVIGKDDRRKKKERKKKERKKKEKRKRKKKKGKRKR